MGDPKTKLLPSAKELLRLFRYDRKNGELWWRSGLPISKRVAKRIENKKAGYINNNGYVSISVLGDRFTLSRLIWRIETGDDPGDLLIDHIDRDRSNNRFRNLRLASNRGNRLNSNTRSDNKTGHVGVDFVRGAYRARIYFTIGIFKSAKEAAAARRKAMKLLSALPIGDIPFPTSVTT